MLCFIAFGCISTWKWRWGEENPPDTPYCTVDTSRANAAEKARANPAAVREAMEREARNQQGKESWRGIAVTMLEIGEMVTSAS